MSKWTVEYHGSIEVEADSEGEAECNAAFECRPDNCRVTGGAEFVEDDRDFSNMMADSEDES
jgi:hypothetical protein